MFVLLCLSISLSSTQSPPTRSHLLASTDDDNPVFFTLVDVEPRSTYPARNKHPVDDPGRENLGPTLA
ncbi:hypothetical protein CSUB01_11665 [Colletotrichum sublineola]|uniref:Secreted protein n=1 Tax=Colletotrichum sublineola TaxID=1173701 RepID=A0A066WT75_COLSU|nr:hypothetical protein CSUB01_11665 [Colletotrichum sublineola]